MDLYRQKHQTRETMHRISRKRSLCTLKTCAINGFSSVILASSLIACEGSKIPNQVENNSAETERISSNTQGTFTVPLDNPVSLSGAGASFPAPLFLNWFTQLAQEIPKLQVNYQSVGSGASIQQFITNTIDFGASDVAMTDEEMAKVSRGVLLLPMTAGSLVFAYNLPNVESLKLSRDNYLNIFLGRIVKWNDPQISANNPGIKLPDLKITVVFRSNAGGTTALLTEHLSAISPEWRKNIGAGKTVDWPSAKGHFVGAKGNEGAAAFIMQIEGAIGYMEYGYAKENNLKMAALENQSGSYIVPSVKSAAKTLESIILPANLRAFIIDPKGKDDYPLVTYAWMLVYKQYDNKDKAIGIEAMIEYGLTQGQTVAEELGYIPLPPDVVRKVAEAADQITPDYRIKVD